MIFLGRLPKHFGCKAQQPVSVEELVNSQTMFTLTTHQKVNILFTLLIIMMMIIITIIIIMMIIKLIRIIIISIFMKIRY